MVLLQILLWVFIELIYPQFEKKLLISDIKNSEWIIKEQKNQQLNEKKGKLIKSKV